MAFTSVKTTPGLGDNLVTTAYDLAVAWKLRATPQYRMFVDKRPERPTHKGDTVRLQLFNFFSDAAITAALTPLDEETDVTPTKMEPTSYVELTPKEYGFTVRRTEYIDLTSMVPVDPAIATALADHQGRVIDSHIQAKLDTSTNVLYGGDATSMVTVDAADKLTSTVIRKAVTKMRAASVVPWVGQFYAAGINPRVEHDIREEAGSGGWRVPQEYGATQERLERGEVGQWEGTVFYSNPLTLNTATGAAGASVYRTFFFGREGLAEAVALEPQTRIAPITDNLRRFSGVGWYGVYDHAIYRTDAVLKVLTGSSVAAL